MMLFWTLLLPFVASSGFGSEDENSLRALIRPQSKLEMLQKLLNTRQPVAQQYKLDVIHDPKSVPVRSYSNVIITCALSTTYIALDAMRYLGTARKAGFVGDIAVAVLPNLDSKFLATLLKYNATIFTVGSSCSGKSNILCKFQGKDDMPVSVLRFFAYQEIISKYSSNSKVLMTDFRDVFFQSNPFKQKYVSQMSKPNDIFFFQEPHPNRVLNRDSQNLYFISLCYALDVTRWVATNTHSSSGAVMASRDAALAYSMLIVSQLDPVNRQVFNSSIPDPNNCLRFGVDMGFHNVLLYTDTFAKFMEVKVLQQGEGPVNIIGGYFGENKLLRAYLSEWKILRGDAPYKYIYNWNGEISPVVHQLDRFLNTEIKGSYSAHMAAFQHLN